MSKRRGSDLRILCGAGSNSIQSVAAPVGG